MQYLLALQKAMPGTYKTQTKVPASAKSASLLWVAGIAGIVLMLSMGVVFLKSNRN